MVVHLKSLARTNHPRQSLAGEVELVVGEVHRRLEELVHSERTIHRDK